MVKKKAPLRLEDVIVNISQKNITPLTKKKPIIAQHNKKFKKLRPYDLGSDSGTKPHDLGSDLGTKPHDLGTKPHDLGTKPHDLGTKPHDLGSKPHDLGSNLGTKPHDLGTKPHDLGSDFAILKGISLKIFNYFLLNLSNNKQLITKKIYIKDLSQHINAKKPSIKICMKRLKLKGIIKTIEYSTSSTNGYAVYKICPIFYKTYKNQIQNNNSFQTDTSQKNHTTLSNHPGDISLQNNSKNKTEDNFYTFKVDIKNGERFLQYTQYALSTVGKEKLISVCIPMKNFEAIFANIYHGVNGFEGRYNGEEEGDERNDSLEIEQEPNKINKIRSNLILSSEEESEQGKSTPLNWLNIDISPLTEFGFGKNQELERLEQKGILTPEQVQLSIHHYAWALEHKKSAQKYKEAGSNPLSVLMNVLLVKNTPWVEGNYRSPQEIALGELAKAQKEEAKRIDKLKEELQSSGFKIWDNQLSSEEKSKIEESERKQTNGVRIPLDLRKQYYDRERFFRSN